jgi:hypothetical protein
MVDKFTIEDDTLYFGRDDQRHGYNLGQLTDRSFNALGILNQHSLELDQWRRLGRNIIVQLDDWSAGYINKQVYISDERREEIERLLNATPETENGRCKERPDNC